MKKLLFCVMLGCLFFACSKDKKSTPPPKTDPNKTYAAHFTVSASTTSSQTTNSLHTNTTVPVAVSAVANKLLYYVFNSSGSLITQLVQDSTATNFGQITDTFTPGTYTIVFVSYKVTSKFTPPPTPASLSTALFNAQGFDTFYKSFSITVTDSAITQDVTLDRVVGQLQVQITDPIPTGTKTIEVDVVSDRSISFATGLPVTTTNTLKLQVPIPAGAIGQSNFTITTYVGNTTSSFTVNLIASNASGIFVNVSTPNITCQANTRTLLSGQLFTKIAGTDNFTIGYDRAWDDNPITINF